MAETGRYDAVICLGAVTHHVMAGFGGGRKSILPGISSRETIFHNHAFSLDAAQLRSNPAIGNGVLKGNPLHEDMCEAAGLVKNLFIWMVQHQNRQDKTLWTSSKKVIKSKFFVVI